MKFPRVIKRHCPYCKKHTEHKVIVSKKKSPMGLSYGSKNRAKKRGFARGQGNRGRYSKPAVTKFKMTGRKSTKNLDLRFECNVCKKQHVQKKGIRTKKFDLK